MPAYRTQCWRTIRTPYLVTYPSALINIVRRVRCPRVSCRGACRGVGCIGAEACAKWLNIWSGRTFMQPHFFENRSTHRCSCCQIRHPQQGQNLFDGPVSPRRCRPAKSDLACWRKDDKTKTRCRAWSRAFDLARWVDPQKLVETEFSIGLSTWRGWPIRQLPRQTI